MSEENFRYHVKKGMNDPEMIRNFKALMRAKAQALIDDLSEVPDDQK